MAQRNNAERQVRRPALRVLHRGTAMVPDYRALMDTNTRRHVGLRFDPTLGPEDDFLHPRPDGRGYDTVRGHHGGFVKMIDEPVTIPADDPHYGEYIRHLKDGDLWAADQETASAAGVAFEPDFEGEHPQSTAAQAPKKSAPKSTAAPAETGK
jgi:hypothetical protein